MKKSKQKNNEEENLEFVPSLKPSDDDISEFNQRPEKKPNGNATLGDILRQPGEPDEVIKPEPKVKNLNIMPFIFISAAWLIILGVVSGVLFSKISVLEQQVLAFSSDKAQGFSDHTAANQMGSIEKSQLDNLQIDLKKLENLVYQRNKNSIANNTGRITNLRNTTRESKQAINMLTTELEELKAGRMSPAGSNKSSKITSNVSNTAFRKLEKKQLALEKRLAQELISLKKLESMVNNIGSNTSVKTGRGTNSAELAGLNKSLTKLEKQIKANNESIDTVEMHNEKLKRSISLLRAESARVYRLVESSMKK